MMMYLENFIGDFFFIHDYIQLNTNPLIWFFSD